MTWALAAVTLLQNADTCRADLDAFIDEVDATYPFFDLKGIRGDWEAAKARLRAAECGSDEAFVRLVRDAIRCLRDAHMGITRAPVAIPEPPPRFYAGVDFLPATEDRVVIAGAPAETGLAPGDIVRTIDGVDAREWLEDAARRAWTAGGPFSSPQRARLYAYRLPFAGERGERRTIAVGDREIALENTVEVTGWRHTYAMPEGLGTQGSVQFGRLPSGYGYVYLRRLQEDLPQALDRTIEAAGDVPGWIVDLRGCGGGGYTPAEPERFRGRGPVVALIDAGTFSAGETFARDLHEAAGATLVGETTAGSSTAKRRWATPSGRFELVLSTRSRYGIGGRPIEFNGVAPDQVVEVDPEELRRGVNSGIAAAERFLDGSR